MTLIRRNLPAIIGEVEVGYNSPVYYEDPETVSAKQNTLEYLKTLREKIKYDHEENMVKIQNNHEEIMKSMQYQAANNFIGGLNSSDRLEVESIQTFPYVREKTWFGLEKKSEGITIKVNRR